MKAPEQALKKASAIFHQEPDHYNCAQSVAKLCDRDDLVPGFRAFGGGRAEGGLCGALFAALAVSEPGEEARIRKEFEEKVGALTCKEIKGGQKTPCPDCVAWGMLLARPASAASPDTL